MNIIPIILAAGEGRRLGRTKALVPFDGRTAVDLVLAACRDGGAGAPLVVLGHDAASVAAALPPGTSTCRNPDHDASGPARSLQVGLDHLPPGTDAFLLYPVDYPLVTGPVVRALCACWPAARARGRRIAIPSHQMRRGHPALFDLSLADELRALASDEPIHRVVRARAAEIEHVEVEDPAVLMNLNTPEDYDRCLAAYRERGR